MNHLGTKALESDRLLLRRFCIDDAQAMYDNWTNDPEVSKYLMWPYHTSVEASRSVLNDWIPQYSESDYYHWAIVLKDNDDMPIGSIGVMHKSDRAEMVHIGYCIGKKWWNQGIVSEALTLLIAFFFNEVEVNRIESRHDPRNPSSGKVMLKCGLIYEGTQREADWNNQGICDAAMYAILKKDFNPAV
jgi:ribosomal-protein-alanine N-acetyltransferase